MQPSMKYKVKLRIKKNMHLFNVIMHTNFRKDQILNIRDTKENFKVKKLK